MKKIKTKDGYDFYIHLTAEGFPNNLYNIVPEGSKPPEGGYRNKEYIERIKGVKFDE
jgi:hypothetical protein